MIKKFRILRSGQFFKLQVGLTIFEYQIKVDYACKQLMNKEISITEVKFDSGFNNLSHFNKQFKIIIGVTLMKFRQCLQNSILISKNLRA